MNELDVLVSLLSKTLNKSADDVKSIILNTDGKLKDDALPTLLTMDAERIRAIDDRNKSDRDNQYKRGQREMSEKYQKDLREAFSLDTDLKDEDLLEAAKAKIGQAGDGSGTLTDDKVKAHPLYKGLLKEKRDNEKAINDQWQKKLDEANGEFNNKLTRGSVNSRAMAIVKSLKLKLSADPIKQEKQLAAITSQLSGYTFEPDGDSFIVNKDGQPHLDAHKNLVSFESLVKEVATSMFDVEEAEPPKKLTGNQNEFGKKWDKTTVPKDGEGLRKALAEAKSPEEQEAISTAYREAQKATA